MAALYAAGDFSGFSVFGGSGLFLAGLYHAKTVSGRSENFAHARKIRLFSRFRRSQVFVLSCGDLIRISLFNFRVNTFFQFFSKSFFVLFPTPKSAVFSHFRSRIYYIKSQLIM